MAAEDLVRMFGGIGGFFDRVSNAVANFAILEFSFGSSIFGEAFVLFVFQSKLRGI
jgi:hypothetical protein